MGKGFLGLVGTLGLPMVLFSGVVAASNPAPVVDTLTVIVRPSCSFTRTEQRNEAGERVMLGDNNYEILCNTKDNYQIVEVLSKTRGEIIYTLAQ